MAQGRLRALVDQALRKLQDSGVRDWFPPAVVATLRLPSLQAKRCSTCITRPSARSSLNWRPAGIPRSAALPSRNCSRTSFRCRLLKRSIKTRARAGAAGHCGLERTIRRLAAFALTAAQERVLREIEQDLQQQRPMVRLIQGDVGCGKTVVAAAAAARAVGSGVQAALMAPDRAARRAALALARCVVPAAAAAGGAAVRIAAGARATQCARSGRQRRGAHGRRHARAVPGRHRLREPRARHRGRAAPLRRAAAPAAARTKARKTAASRTSSS